MKVTQVSSMAHAIDVAVSYRFHGHPYECIAVRPDSVTLARGFDPRYSGPDMIRIEVKR